MKHCFVINPKAGNGEHTEALCESIRQTCEERKVEYEIYMTRSVGDAEAFTRAACASPDSLNTRFYACGGDGTLGEVVNGAITRKGVEVGLIPIGTGNDYVRNFSNGEKFFDIGAQIDGAALPVDVLSCNQYHSINMINIGFDCEVVKKKEKLQQRKFLPSKLAYVFGLVITLFKKPGMKARVFVDGEEIADNDFLLSTYANGKYCGGGFKSNPTASVSGGKIDALFVRNISRTRFISLVGSYKKGTHLVPKNEKILFTKKASSILLKFPKTQAISVDGEIRECEELSIECLPFALPFSVPAGSELKEYEPQKEEAEAVI